MMPELPTVALGQQRSAWGEPEPFRSEPKEHIDVDCLPPVFADMCKAVTESLSVSQDLVAASLIGILSVCLNRHRVIIDDGRDWDEPLCLYMMGIAPPGEKKSPVLKLLRKPVDDWVRRTNEERKPLIAESKQQYKNLQKQLKRAEIDLENGKGDEAETLRLAAEIDAFQPVKPIRLYSGDTTTEKLADLLQENDEQFSILSTEGGILQTIAGRYQNGVANSDLYLQAFNGEPVSVDRKNSGSILLNGPTLSIILFCQPVVWSSLIEKDELRNNGFVDRFLPFAPKSCIGQDRFRAPILPPKVVTNYANAIERLLNIDSTIYLRMSPGAGKAYEDFFDGFTKDIQFLYEDMTGWASKHRGIVARIAAILQLADDGSATITSDNMYKAILIADYFQEQARVILRSGGMGQAEQQAQHILRRLKEHKELTFINEAGETVIKYRDLYNYSRKNGLRKKEDYKEPLQVLVDKGYIDMDGADFEKVTEYYINPTIWGTSK